jgi:hypothetical protein
MEFLYWINAKTICDEQLALSNYLDIGQQDVLALQAKIREFLSFA